MVEKDRWPVLLGTPHPADKSAPKPPTDPFMIETPDVRIGGRYPATNPISGTKIEPATSNNPQANVINGHEQNVPDFADLQYACTFKLQKPKDCMPGDAACDCSPDKAGKSDAVTAANSPLCQGGANHQSANVRQGLPGRPRAAGAEGPGRQRHRRFDLPQGHRAQRRRSVGSELRLQPGRRRHHQSLEGCLEGQVLAACDRYNPRGSEQPSEERDEPRQGVVHGGRSSKG